MGLVSESAAASPLALLGENSIDSLSLLEQIIQAQSGVSEETCESIAPQLCDFLTPNGFDWNWLRPAGSDPIKELHLNIAVTCLEHCKKADLQIRLMLALSLYFSENVPWSNLPLSRISRAAARDVCKAHLPAFADLLYPRFLSIKGTKLATVQTKGNKQSRFTKTRVAKPALGLQISSLAEENERSAWKDSINVTALSSVLMLLINDEKSEYIAKCASFTLNVLDDSDPLFRAQGCFLLGEMIKAGHGEYLTRSGLLAVFEDSVKTSLTYLPQLTPVEVSLRLLKDAAYPVLLSLIKLNPDTSYVTYLEALDAHVLASISHISGRANDAPTNDLLAFLYTQITVLVEQGLRLSVLACFTRLNYVLCQALSDPFLIEDENGGQVVDAVLCVHRSVLALCVQGSENEPKSLLLQYALDFLGSWAILGRRVVKYGLGTAKTTGLIRENVSLLRDLSVPGGSPDIDQILQSVVAKVPELEKVFY